MTNEEKMSPIESLHENVSSFFNRFQAKYSNDMRCSKGCSACCISGISVFPVEAEGILNWFDKLEDAERERLKRIWKESEILDEETVGRCVFLVGNACSVYPVRPTLCRSQGLPMKVTHSESEGDESGVSFELSLCELNFSDSARLPHPSEWLDLDRLNALVSLAQSNFKEDGQAEGIVLRFKNRDERIGLDSIRARMLET